MKRTRTAVSWAEVMWPLSTEGVTAADGETCTELHVIIKVPVPSRGDTNDGRCSPSVQLLSYLELHYVERGDSFLSR